MGGSGVEDGIEHKGKSEPPVPRALVESHAGASLSQSDPSGGATNPVEYSTEHTLGSSPSALLQALPGSKGLARITLQGAILPTIPPLAFLLLVLTGPDGSP